MGSARHGTRGSDSSGSAVGSYATAAGSSQSRANGRLPLPDDFFRTPKLNANEAKYLVNLAKRACKEVVFYSRRSGGPMHWVHLSSDDGIDVFQGMDESPSAAAVDTKSITYLRGATRIYATIDEIADFFKLDTPMKLSGFTQTVGKDLLDQKTLYDLAMPTVENPKHYVGVKWTAVESPSKLARNRDFCYLECHDEFIDTNSRKRGWVRSLHSIRLPFCGELTKSHGLVRGSLYRSGFVFLESNDRTYVDAVHTLHMDIKGNAPNWLKILVMKRRIKNIAEVNRYFQLRRLCAGRLLSDLELPSKSGVPKCQICRTRFGLFSRKAACRKCGKVICSPCGHHFILDYAGVGAKKVRICAHCSDRVVHGNEGSGSMTQSNPMSHVGAHQLDAVQRPLYDQSPTSRTTQSRLSRQRSTEEREYYRANEDDRGLADIEDAKRMHREFEDQYTWSGQNGHSSEAVAVAGMPPVLNSAAAGGGGSGGGSARRQSQRGGLYEDGVMEERLSRKAAPPRVSAFQEFLKTERVRQKNIGAPVVATSRAAPVRKSVVPSGGPGSNERNSRGRPQSRNRGRFSSSSSELEFPLPPPAGQGHFETLQSGANYDLEYAFPVSKLQRLQENGSLLSDEVVGAPIRRSDLSIGRSSTVSARDAFHAHGVLDHDLVLPEEITHLHQAEARPTMPSSYPSPTSTDSFSRGGSALVYKQHPRHYVGPSPRPNMDMGAFQQFRRSYFDARNSGMTELQERLQSQPSTDEEGADFRFGYDATSAASDDTDFTGDKEYEVPVPLPVHRSTAEETVEETKAPAHTATAAAVPPRASAADLATVMALSAMQLYEKENGADLQVSEETRQAALKKMIEIYSNELERNTIPSTTTESDPRALRSVSVSAPSASVRHTMNPNGVNHFQGVDRLHAQTEMVACSPEYRDLSDLSASAFKAYQKGGLDNHGSFLVRSDAEPSLRSSAADASRREKNHFGPESKSSSHHNVALGSEDPFREDAATTHRGSISNSESHGPKFVSPVRDDVSDTFSELELIDLPHLMRAEEPTVIESRSVDRLSQESRQNASFSEVSGGRLSSILDIYPHEVQTHGDPTTRSSYASFQAEPNAHSPPSAAARSHSISSISDDTDTDAFDDGDFTSRTMMTQSELERYRASLAQLMADYTSEHDDDASPTTGGRLQQPEREREPDTSHKNLAGRDDPPQPNGALSKLHALSL